MGRPITDIASQLTYAALADYARGAPHAEVTRDGSAGDDGVWFLVRILPYRTLEEIVDGVVITFTDIDQGGN